MTENTPLRQSSATSRPVRALTYVAEGVVLSGVLGFVLSLVSRGVPSLASWVSLSVLQVVFVCSLVLAGWLGFIAIRTETATPPSNDRTGTLPRPWRWVVAVAVPLTVFLVGVIELLWGWDWWVADTELPFLWLCLVLLGGVLRLLIRYVRSALKSGTDSTPGT